LNFTAKATKEIIEKKKFQKDVKGDNLFSLLFLLAFE